MSPVRSRGCQPVWGCRPAARTPVSKTGNVGATPATLANSCREPASACTCLQNRRSGGSVREVLQKPLRRDGHGMRVISQSPDPLARMHTMTKRQGKSGTIDVKALLREDEEFLRALVRTALQEVLEAEMTEVLGAEKGERAAGRQGYRSGYYGRTLITRVGKLELRVPQDRAGRFSTELFERYQRSERALVAALAEM